MKTSKRIDEMMNSMKAFERVAYPKSELLQEMIKLQSEMAMLAFGNEETTQNKKVWDIEAFLEKKNDEAGHPADAELQRFKNNSKAFCNLIRAEIRGRSGEMKVFRNLDYLDTTDIVLRNVELKDEVTSTELDAVVLTPEAVVIVEVKNTNKDVFIDQSGYLYRVNDQYNNRDCNIGEKMEQRENMLRKVLRDGGFDDVVIRSVVVFTSEKRIELVNKYNRIKTCFLGQLNYVIDGYFYNKNNNHETLCRMAECIKRIETGLEYSLSREFDFTDYKKEFVELIAKIEEGPVVKSVAVRTVVADTKKTRKKQISSRLYKNKYNGIRVRMVAAASAISVILINTVVLAGMWKKDSIA